MASKHNLDFVDLELKKIKEKNLYRSLRYGRVQGSHIMINGKKLINLCSNDYLGIKSTSVNDNQFQSSSRLVSGNDERYKILEETIAKHKSQQKCLVYPTGYMANLGSISTVVKKGDLILSDELNHVSIIESCKLSDAKVLIYKHNDMDDLRKKIKQNGKNKFVITEGIFSMDGDYSLLKQITEIAEEKNAITIVDDAHGDFAVGNDGKGTPDLLNVSKKIDLYVSSLSKGLGSFGGYVTSQKNVIDLCINRSKSFIYTSALPSVFVEHALKRIKNKTRKRQQKKLEEKKEMLIKGLKDIGYNINSGSHIIPILIGNEKKTIDFGKFLFSKGVFAQPIRYPTVPKKKARLRVSVTAWLTSAQINKALDNFEKAYKKFDI